MLDSTTKRRIDACRDILVGKVPDPRSQIDQVTVALIYKFMHDMDQEAVELGGKPTFFAKHSYKVVVDGKEEKREQDYAQYAWPRLMDPGLGGEERVKLYAEALERMPENPGLPPLFRDIFKNTFLPYRDPATLREFLKCINEFTYDHSEKLGDAFEYLLSIMGSQGDAGQFRTPRHLIDFMTAVIDPQKHETILDPACGTAGFLISAYKHILRKNSSEGGEGGNGGKGGKGGDGGDGGDGGKDGEVGAVLPDAETSAKRYSGDLLTPDDRKKLVRNITGYDIDPGMVKLALVNLYLHGFPDPHIYEYDTLTSTDRWEDRFDVVLANPPFMSPKGGIKPHGKFGIPSTRSEVLFVDYIAEHLHPNGRALLVVPEGIIFQSGKAYKALRKKLVDEHYLVGVVSVPGGVFNPYSGVKTSLLWFDRALARKTDKLLFVKVEHDGYDLGAQRRPIAQNDLPEAYRLMMDYRRALVEGTAWEAPEGWEGKAHLVERSVISKGEEYSLNGDLHVRREHASSDFEMVRLADVCDLRLGATPSKQHGDFWENGTVKWISNKYISDEGKIIGFDLINEKALVETSVKLAPKGSTIIVTRVSVGKTAYADEDYAINQDMTALVSKDTERLLPRYLWCISRHIGELVDQCAKGVAVRGVSLKFMAEVRIPLPPLAEQEALVAEVEGYQQVIDGARHVVAHYKPRITIDPAWEMVELGEVCESITDGDHMPPPKTESGVPFVTITNIETDNKIDFTKTYFVSEEYYANLKEHRKPKRGDVLYTVTGSYGVPVLVDFDKRFCFQRHIGLLRSSERVLPQFLYYLLCSQYMKHQADKAATGVAQKTVSLSSLRCFTIPLPPLADQERIVAALEEERRMVEGCRALIARMEAKVRERVARVWGGSPIAPVSAAAPRSSTVDISA